MDSDDKIRLWDFQNSAVRAVWDAYRRGLTRVLLVSPGGSGKTVMLGAVARKAINEGRRVLVFAHRRELVFQAVEHFGRMGVTEHRIGVLLPGLREEPDRPLQVGSVQTLYARLDTLPPADFVIVDEAHHAAADSYRAVAARYPKARWLGLTGTPFRLDGQGLKSVFDEMVVAAKSSELIATKRIALPRIFAAPEDALPNLQQLRRVAGDYALGPLSERMNRSTLVGGLVHNYRRHADGETALVFAVSVAHSERIVRGFERAGIVAAHLDGTTSTRDREQILADFGSGKIKVLSNCMLLSEGYDLPRCGAVLLARPTLSLALYLQQVARALRWYHGKRPVVLDHARNVRRFGLPHSDREFSLDDGVAHGAAASLVRECKSCGAFVSIGCRVCPECGTEFREEPSIPTVKPMTLVEITKKQQEELAVRLRAHLRQRGETDEAWVERVVAAWTATNAPV